jgi:hypothetical protein
MAKSFFLEREIFREAYFWAAHIVLQLYTVETLSHGPKLIG